MTVTKLSLGNVGLLLLIFSLWIVFLFIYLFFGGGGAVIVKCFVIICSVGGCIKTALVDSVVCVCERERIRQETRAFFGCE